ncbi:MAG TPA: cytochrome c biogenesis protein CcsA [Stellaceae bacterium]|nr:cytochrome c biogenesis protein CcsA [Stellaceae bacterium]
MSGGALYGVLALVALIPMSALRLRAADRRDLLFWLCLGIAIAGPATSAAMQLGGAWRTGFAMSLWLTIAVTLALFACVSAAIRQAWRLAPILLPYLLILGAMALVWQRAPERPLIEGVPAGWFGAHILFALLTVGLLTLAAVAGTGVLLQERALKARRPTGLTRSLPAVADGERLQLGLLATSEVVLGLGLASGMAAEHFLNGRLLALDHKTILSLAAFVAIALLLVAHRFTGVRGQRAARGVLAAYLLLMLAYPGVKFVTDVLMG